MSQSIIEEVNQELFGESARATITRFYFEECGEEIANSLAELYMKLKGIKFNEEHHTR